MWQILPNLVLSTDSMHVAAFVVICKTICGPALSSHAPAHEVLGVQLLDALLRVDGAVVAY